MKNSSSVSATKLRRKTERDPHLALILKRLRHEALYNKQEVIVDCSWYTGVGIHENSDRHYLSQPADPKRVSQWISTQLADGSWPDIPYWPQKKDSPWWVTAPQTHICWLLALSEAWHHRDSPHRSNAELLQTIVRGLEFWCLHDFSTLGWWWTQIGLPRWLCRIIALMEQSLPQAVITKSLEIIGRADGPTPWGKSLVGTAQNQVWAAENVFILACLENNPNRARSAVDIIINEITVRPDWGEGLQADYSFQQHGNTLYSGGYGYYFAVDIPRLAHLVHNTPYALPQAALNHITRYLLDHQRLITRSTNYAYTAVGRLIARQGDTAWLLPNAYRALARLPLTTPLQTLAANTAAALDGDVTAAKHAFYGNSCFWRSDFMAHQHPDYHASVKLHSDRLLNNDVPCNDEGLQSHHLSDGAFCLMRHGREYANLFPAWKWHRIPGTTAIQLRSRLTTATPIPTAGRRPFAGGVSNGTTGCIGYDFATAADPAAANSP